MLIRVLAIQKQKIPAPASGARTHGLCNKCTKKNRYTNFPVEFRGKNLSDLGYMFWVDEVLC